MRRRLRDLGRRILVRLEAVLDLVAHSRKRRLARLRLLQRAQPRHIAVVCYGNICRSPYAAEYLRLCLTQFGDTEIVVESAGLFGPDRPANDQALAVARTRGVDLSHHRSRLWKARQPASTDLVLVMTRSQRDQLIREFGVPANTIELLGDFDLSDPPQREISDPYGRPDEEFRRVFEQIDRAVAGLCDILQKQDEGATIN